MTEDLTKKRNEQAQVALSKRNAELAALRVKLEAQERARTELEQENEGLKDRLLAIETLASETDKNLREHIEKQHQLLVEKEQVIQTLLGSTALKVGQSFVAFGKRLPGGKRFASLIRR